MRVTQNACHAGRSLLISYVKRNITVNQKLKLYRNSWDKERTEGDMTKTNKIKNCTHPVPANKYGIFALHCEDNQAIEMADMKAIIEGPISEIESDYRLEISKPVELKKHN